MTNDSTSSVQKDSVNIVVVKNENVNKMDNNNNETSDERDNNTNSNNYTINNSNKHEEVLDNMMKRSSNQVNNKMTNNDREMVLTADALKPLDNNTTTKNKSPSIDDNNESASNSSNSGKSGSGIGYNADYSASDDQSDTSGEQRELQQMLHIINKIEIHNNNDSSFNNNNNNKSSNINFRESDIVRDNSNKKHHSKRSSSDKRSHNTKQQIDENESISNLKIKSSRGSENYQRTMVEAVGLNEKDYPSFHHQGSAGGVESNSSSHWNGIHITNPMDPRLDLLSAQQIQSLSSSTNNGVYTRLANENDVKIANSNTKIDQGNRMAVVDHNHYGGGGLEGLYGFTTTNTNSTVQTTTVQQQQPLQQSQPNLSDGQVDIGLSYENYMRLLEAVRPYFHAYGVALNQQQQHQLMSPMEVEPEVIEEKQHQQIQQEVSRVPHNNNDSSSSENNMSSEGFTAYFTTTDSNANSNTDAVSSNGSKQGTSSERNEMMMQQKHHDGDKSDGGDSSMIVLARSKRKHNKDVLLKNQHQGSSSSEDHSNTASSLSSERKEAQRMQNNDEMFHDQQQNHQAQIHHQQQILAQNAALELQEQQHEAHHNMIQHGADDHHNNHRRLVPPPRVVTDVSSSNRTDSAVSNTTSSGSGSGGNTGSGSNQGSSGSGNDGKGSSEELAKEDNSGDGTNEGSDNSGNNNVGNKWLKPGTSKIGIGLAPTSGHHRHSIGVMGSNQEGTTMKLLNNSNSNNNTIDSQFNIERGHNHDHHHPDQATRDRKLQDKKRKRIEMRREFEAQQHFESSDSTSTAKEHFFRPGRPVTLDQVMIFSMIPRIVTQSSPPFIVIHANAAYVRLTGIDSHVVVGKSITEVLIIRMNAAERLEDPQQQQLEEQQRSVYHHDGGSDIHNPNHRGARNRGRNEIGLERLVASSGFGQYHHVQVATQNHQMIGRNVTVVTDRQSTNTPMPTSREGGNGSIVFDEQLACVQCRASIAPIISNSSSMDYPSGSQKEKDAKRQKQFHYNVPEQLTHRRYLPLQLVTHYVIQLQPLGEDCEQPDSAESLSSNPGSIESVEARLMGLTKDELHRQRAVTSLQQDLINQRDLLPAEDSQGETIREDISTADSSTTKKPVVAVG